MFATAFAAYGPDDLTVLSVGSYTRQREVKLSSGWWMYSFKVNVTSTGKLPLGGVCGQVKSSSSSVKVIDPEVCFPDIPAGESLSCHQQGHLHHLDEQTSLWFPDEPLLDLQLPQDNHRPFLSCHPAGSSL